MHAAVAVMEETLRRLPPLDRHLERIERELGAYVVRHRPADDPAAAEIKHSREVEETLVGLDVGDVGEPHLVDLLHRELAIENVRRDGMVVTRIHGHDSEPLRARGPDRIFPHDAGDGVATDVDASTDEFVPHANASVVVVDGRVHVMTRTGNSPR